MVVPDVEKKNKETVQKEGKSKDLQNVNTPNSRDFWILYIIKWPYHLYNSSALKKNFCIKLEVEPLLSNSNLAEEILQ